MPDFSNSGHLAVCEHCDQICEVPVLAHGELAKCPRCGESLERASALGPREMLAICITAIVVFVMANAYPLVTLEVQGMARHASLLEAIAVTWNQPGLWGVALMAMITVFILPLGQLLLLLGLLLMLMSPRLPAGFDLATRLLRVFRPWSMVPVFVLGVLVAIVKIADMAKIIVGAGLWSMAALVVLLTVLSRLDSRMLWRFAEQSGATRPSPFSRLLKSDHQRSIGHDNDNNYADRRLLACEVCGYLHDASDAAHAADVAHAGGVAWHGHCERCHASMHLRKPDSFARSWAFLITGLVLYIPANVLPIMRTTSFFGASEHTILGGVVELWEGGAPDIALIVFVASIAVPMIKFVVLVMLLLAAHRAQNGFSDNEREDQRVRAKLYRFIEFIGQWSMLDVFVVLLLAALVNFQGLMQITAGYGALAFGMTVAFTMLAAMSFDPRLIWDKSADGFGQSNFSAPGADVIQEKAEEPGELNAR